MWWEMDNEKAHTVWEKHCWESKPAKEELISANMLLDVKSSNQRIHLKRLSYSSNFKYTYQKIVIICFLGGPRNSGLCRCSRTHTTAPTKRKKAPVTHHIWAVNGLRKDQGLDLTSLTGTTTTSPDSMKGWVKSKILVLFGTIVISPTAAS